MSNSSAKLELHENLRKHLNLSAYALNRNLSFSTFHLRKAKACLEALGCEHYCSPLQG